jgi:hypothetical protein
MSPERFVKGRPERSCLQINHLLIRPLRDFLNLGPFGSNQKLLHFLNCSTLLRWDRVQINLSRDLRRRVTEQRLHRA